MLKLKINTYKINRVFRNTVAIAAIGCAGLFSVPFALAEDQVAETTKQTASQNLSQVNINTASASELAAGLKNVGAKKAEVIVSYREEYGPFNKAEQLLEVPGIGPKLFEMNKDRISVDN